MATVLLSLKRHLYVPGFKRQNGGHMLWRISSFHALASEETYKASDFFLTDWERSLSPERLKLLRLIQYEYQLWKLEDSSLPDNVSEKYWERAMDLKDFQRKSFFKGYVAKIVRTETRETMYKENKKQQNQLLRDVSEPEPVDQCKNPQFFRQIQKHHMDELNRCRVASAIINSAPRVVLETAYVEHLQTEFEVTLSGNALKRAFSYNFHHKSPFQLSITGFKEGSLLWNELSPRHLRLDSSNYHFLDISAESVWDMYPPSSLFCLTRHTPHVLEEYDPDKIYVICPLTTVPQHSKLALRFLKRVGVKCVRLPYDRYLKSDVKTGSAIMRAPNIMSVLLDLHLNSGDMKTALENVRIRPQYVTQPSFTAW